MTNTDSKIIEIAKIAFWGGKHSDLLFKIFPNGCTLKDAIDYFVLYEEELNALGLI